MCDECFKYDYICYDCGRVIDSEFGTLVPYKIERRTIKNLVATSNSNNFVWILLFNNKPVKIGAGSLVKLLNETRPNATYIRFNECIIYYCKDEEQRNEFATKSMGYIPGLVNRKGLKNNLYKTYNEIALNISKDAKDRVLGEPDFRIGDMGYWRADNV